jgi:hypothetical protein
MASLEPKNADEISSAKPPAYVEATTTYKIYRAIRPDGTIARVRLPVPAPQNNNPTKTSASPKSHVDASKPRTDAPKLLAADPKPKTITPSDKHTIENNAKVGIPAQGQVNGSKTEASQAPNAKPTTKPALKANPQKVPVKESETVSPQAPSGLPAQTTAPGSKRRMFSRFHGFRRGIALTFGALDGDLDILDDIEDGLGEGYELLSDDDNDDDNDSDYSDMHDNDRRSGLKEKEESRGPSPVLSLHMISGH